jgi:hypothetical protein
MMEVWFINPWTPTKNGAVEMILNTLCEISKANDEDLLEALMSMHDKETVALRKTLQRVFATLDAVQSELDGQ